MTQTAEGALGEVENILQRLRELAVQAGNSTLNASDRAQIQLKLISLLLKLTPLLQKQISMAIICLMVANASLNFQVGVDASDQLSVALKQTDSSSLNINSQLGTSSLISDRIADPAGDIAAADVKINGFDALAATFSDPTSSQTSGIAAQLATAINANSGTHGAYANAFNKLTSNNVGVWAMSGSVILNGVTITVKCCDNCRAFVKAVNEEVADVTATLMQMEHLRCLMTQVINLTWCWRRSLNWSGSLNDLPVVLLSCTILTALQLELRPAARKMVTVPLQLA